MNANKTISIKSFAILAWAGLLWNLFGVFQFIQSLVSTPESLIQMGMSDVKLPQFSGHIRPLRVGDPHGKTTSPIST